MEIQEMSLGLSERWAIFDCEWPAAGTPGYVTNQAAMDVAVCIIPAGASHYVDAELAAVPITRDGSGDWRISPNVRVSVSGRMVTMFHEGAVYAADLPDAHYNFSREIETSTVRSACGHLDRIIDAAIRRWEIVPVPVYDMADPNIAQKLRDMSKVPAAAMAD